MGMSSQSEAPAALPHGKEIPEPTVKKLGGGKSQCGRFWRSDKPLAPAGNRITIPCSPAPSTVIITTKLFQRNYTLRKAWKPLHFIMRILKKGNNNMKRLAYTALVRPILEYGAVCWNPYREGQVGALNWVQKRAAKFTNNIDESGWETLAQRRLIARICALFRHTP